jgi:hypothetical protein
MRRRLAVAPAVGCYVGNRLVDKTRLFADVAASEPTRSIQAIAVRTILHATKAPYLSQLSGLMTVPCIRPYPNMPGSQTTARSGTARSLCL